MADALFDAFLSHDSDDKPFVGPVASVLQNSQLRCFYDADAILPSQQFQAKIEFGMTHSRCCVAFVGKNGITSHWHKFEADMAVRLNRVNPDGFPVIPVLLPGVDGETFQSQYPSLAAFSRVQFADTHDPVALQRLIRGIRGADTSPATPQPDPPCPYLGLDNFDVDDAGRFFGREVETAELIARLRRANFLAVIAHGRIWIIVPGDHPLDQLAYKLFPGDAAFQTRNAFIDETTRNPRTLRIELTRRAQHGGPDGRALLIVDQCEELFTRETERNTAERDAFVRAVLTCKADGSPSLQFSRL